MSPGNSDFLQITPKPRNFQLLHAGAGETRKFRIFPDYPLTWWTFSNFLTFAQRGGGGEPRFFFRITSNPVMSYFPTFQRGGGGQTGKCQFITETSSQSVGCRGKPTSPEKRLINTKHFRPCDVNTLGRPLVEFSYSLTDDSELKISGGVTTEDVLRLQMGRLALQRGQQHVEHL